MQEETTRKRRSNFDVGPEELGLPVPLYAPHAGAGPMILPHGGPPVPIRSLIDQTERDRIRRATERNLAYIKRKVAEETERKFGLAGHGKGEEDGGYYMYGGGGEEAKRQKKAQGGGGGGGQKRSRAGIGAMPMGPVPGAPVGDVSVYVSNLPKDATWTQLDMIFSPYGTVRRIKLYRDQNGHPKGDALVTYAKPGSADAAVRKVNGMVVAEGYSISVSKADFSVKEDGGHDGIGFHDSAAHPGQEEDEQADYEVLPPECEADKYPVVILRNVYMPQDAEGDPDFFADLEADMLSECVKFGNVRRIVTPEGPYYEGSVAMVFERTVDAQKCAQAMHGRFFDGRQIEVEMQGNLDPSAVLQKIVPGAALVSGDYGEEDDDDHQPQQAAAGAQPPAAAAAAASSAEAEDVDAFFQSLI